jgi:hypothetical protein
MITFLRVLMKVALPGYLVLMAGAALFGYLDPWGPATPVIAEHQGQMPITVGLGYSEQHEAPHAPPRTTHSYVFFPEVLRDPKVIVVSQIADEPVIALDSRLDFWLNLFWAILAAYGTWFFWLRRTRKGVT